MGIGLGDIAKLQKLIIRLSLKLGTGIDYFETLSIFEIGEIVEGVIEIGKEH